MAPPSPRPFLVATSLDSIKPDDKSRKLIRRYVTKGKKNHRPARPKRVLRSWFGGSEASPPCASTVLCRGPVTATVEPRMLQVLHECASIASLSSIASLY